MTDKIRPLVSISDPILRQETSPFDFQNPPIDPIELAHILSQSLLFYQGFGLAAPQIGLPYRVFVMKSNPIICCFNPKIVDTSTEMLYLEEGCLSIPGISIKRKRFKRMRGRYTLPNGTTETHVFENMTSRIFQHELDHLNGKLMTTGQNRVTLELLVSKAKKRGFGYSVADLIK